MMSIEAVMWVTLGSLLLMGIGWAIAHAEWLAAQRTRIETAAMIARYLDETKRAFALMRGGNPDEAIAVLQRAARDLEQEGAA